MGIALYLSAFTLKHAVEGACEALGPGKLGSDAITGLFTRHFTDPSQRLHKALEKAHDRAWRVLELALAGDSLWDRCKGVLAGAEYRAFRQQIQEFLAANPPRGLPSEDPRARARCLAELQRARKAGLLGRGRAAPHELAQRAGSLARYTGNDEALLAAEWQAIEQVADELRRNELVLLAQVVAVRLPQGQALLVVASRYFFRREVESDAELSRSLTFSQLEGLSHTQQAGFQGLHDALGRHHHQLDDMLAGLADAIAEVHTVAVETRDEVRQLRDLLLAGAVPLPVPVAVPVPPPPPIAAPLPTTARITWTAGGVLRGLRLFFTAVVEAGRQTSRPLCLRVEPVDDPANRAKSVNISSHHFTLRYLGDSVELIDPGSSNGTFVNRQRLAAGQPCRLLPGMTAWLADALELQFQPVPRRDAPADVNGLCRAARAHADNPLWLQNNLIGANRPGWVAFLRINRRNNLPQEEYALLFHAGAIGGGPESLIHLGVAGDLARLLVLDGRLCLERTGVEPVTLAGRALRAGTPVPLSSSCDWSVGQTAFRLEI